MSAVEHYPRGVAVEQPQINWDSPQIKAEIRRQNGNKQGYPDWGTYLRHSMSEGASVEKGVSAAIFFPPLADLEYLQNQGALEKADVLLFARQQELQAAAEHAAQVPTTELTGLASQGRFTIFQGPDDKKGHDILDMAQNALRIDPGNRRIAADYLGYTQIHNALLNGQSAVMFSPTKLRAQNKKDEYGLAFVFVYEGKDHEGNIKFREQICMYKEPYGDPQTSRDLMDSLSQKLGIQRKDTSAWEFADFVAQPLITDKHAALDIKEMQGLFGTTQAERDFGDEFRVLLSRVMEDELRAYGEMLHTHLRLTPNSPKNEIDSFVDTSRPQYKFLEKNNITWENKVGARIKTIRLRGQLSQGLALPVSDFPEIYKLLSEAGSDMDPDYSEMDFSETVGVCKWEKSNNGMFGRVYKRSNWPEFFRRLIKNVFKTFMTILIVHHSMKYHKKWMVLL
jgi:hypothetical protein